MRQAILVAGFFAATAFLLFAVFAAPESSAQDEGPLLVIYSGPNFTGRPLRVTDTLYDMPTGTDAEGNKYSWNDRIRSLKVVKGTWRLYQHGRCNTVLDDTPLAELDLSTKTPERGWSCLVSATSKGPLEVAACALEGLGDDISSIRLVSERNLPDWAMRQ